MKDILDFVVLALFVFMVAMFIINFNRQQIKKHTDKLEKLEEKDAQHEIDAVVNELEREESLINGINKEVEKLDKTLSKIDGDENRVKSYFEQKKALHEIREIVKKVNKL